MQSRQQLTNTKSRCYNFTVGKRLDERPKIQLAIRSLITRVRLENEKYFNSWEKEEEIREEK